MKCPVCSNALREFNAGQLKVDICDQGCSGIWFDKSELEKCDEHTEAFPQEMLRVKKNADVLIDRSKPRACPRCVTVTLKEISLNKDRGTALDFCPQCQGNWLDIGELENIRADAKWWAEVNARQSAFDEKLQGQLKDPATRHRALAFLQVIFK